jgi:hypothetical protein
MGYIYGGKYACSTPHTHSLTHSLSIYIDCVSHTVYIYRYMGGNTRAVPPIYLYMSVYIQIHIDIVVCIYILEKEEVSDANGCRGGYCRGLKLLVSQTLSY